MNYKQLSFQQLKDSYSERPGFTFIAPVPSSRSSIEALYKQIKEAGLCEYEPDFINELNNNNIVAFVYPEGVSFHSCDLVEYGNHVSTLMCNGMFKIDSLAAFLKEN